jgi:outer membrane protein, heavy metal efflux system
MDARLNNSAARCAIRLARYALIILLPLAFTGCVLAPAQLKDEQARLTTAGQPFERPAEDRTLPELSADPGWPDVLRRAFLANGDLEAAYFEWAAAVHRVRQAGGYPNTPLAVNFGYAFSAERMKSFDRLTTTVGPDPMENLAFPSKVYQAAKVALDDARAAGARFSAAKFDLQRKVLTAWYDYALLGERVRVARDNVALLTLINDTAAGRVRAGGAQQDMLRADVEVRRAEDALRTLEAELPAARAMLNAMLARAPDAPLNPPAGIPAARPLPADDAALLARAAEQNPELSALAFRVHGRANALELARMQYIPDINPTLGLTGTAEQMIGLGLSIPTFMPRVRAMVDEARADLRASQAMYRQAKLDRAARVVAALYTLRNAERQGTLFERHVVPTAERIVANAREAYTRGTGTFLEQIDAQRTLLETRLTAVEARAAREKALAELEALIGIDVETLAPPPTTAPITRPTTTTTKPAPPAGGPRHD